MWKPADFLKNQLVCLILHTYHCVWYLMCQRFRFKDAGIYQLLLKTTGNTTTYSDSYEKHINTNKKAETFSGNFVLNDWDLDVYRWARKAVFTVQEWRGRGTWHVMWLTCSGNGYFLPQTLKGKECKWEVYTSTCSDLHCLCPLINQSSFACVSSAQKIQFGQNQ